MFKRLFWFGSGVASGAAGSWWAQRKVRKQLERYTPKGIRDQAKAKAQVSLADGRHRAQRLRSELSARRRRADIRRNNTSGPWNPNGNGSADRAARGT